MDECDPSSPRSAEEQAWLGMVPVGLEIDGLEKGLEESLKPSEASDDGAGSYAPHCPTPDKSQ